MSSHYSLLENIENAFGLIKVVTEIPNMNKSITSNLYGHEWLISIEYMCYSVIKKTDRQKIFRDKTKLSKHITVFLSIILENVFSLLRAQNVIVVSMILTTIIATFKLNLFIVEPP